MTADASMKQATLMGSHCSFKSCVAREIANIEHLKIHWEEDDFKHLGLDKYLVNINRVTGEWIWQ